MKESLHAALRRFAPVVVLTGYAILCLTRWWVPEWRPGPDAGMYVQTALAYAQGYGLTYLDRAIWWPPGLPWLLSWTMPEGVFDPAAANRLVMVFAGLMPTAVFLALRRRHGVAIALVVAILTGTSPIWVARFNYTLAEFPFMVFLFLGFAGTLRAADRDRHWVAAAVLGGASLAAAAMMRSVALVALPAAFFAGWPRDRGLGRWRAALPGLVATALCLPWSLYTATLDAGIEPWDQALVHDYTSAVFRADPNDPESALLGPAAWIDRLSTNAGQVIRVLGVATGVRASLSTPMGLLVLGFAFTGFAIAARRRFGILEWFTMAYGGVVLAYFVTTQRIIAPLLPLLMLYALLAVGEGWRVIETRWGIPFSRREVWGALALAILAGNLWRMPLTLDPARGRFGESATGQSWRVYRHVAEWIGANTNDDAVLLCGPAGIYGVLTERRAYSYLYAPLPKLIRRYRPDYVMLPKAMHGQPRFTAVAARATEQWEIAVPDTPVVMTVFRMPQEPTAPSG